MVVKFRFEQSAIHDPLKPKHLKKIIKRWSRKSFSIVAESQS